MTLAGNVSRLLQIRQYPPNPFSTHARTGALNVGQAEFPGLGADGGEDQFGFCAPRRSNLANTSLELAVGRFKDEQEVVDIRPWIMIPFVPPLGTLLQRLIVSVFVLLDDSLQTDVTTHFVTEVVALENK